MRGPHERTQWAPGAAATPRQGCQETARGAQHRHGRVHPRHGGEGPGGGHGELLGTFGVSIWLLGKILIGNLALGQDTDGQFGSWARY